MRRAIDEQHVRRQLVGPVLCEPAGQHDGAYAELGNRRRALVIEAARGADGRRAECEHDGRLPGGKKLRELRLERRGFVPETRFP